MDFITSITSDFNLHIAGYFALYFMGIILSVVGAGGSILTVPILVYLFSIPTIIATSYALTIVGIIAFLSSISRWRYINLKKIIPLGLTSALSVFITRRFFIPILLENFSDYIINKFLLILLLIIMILAGYFMIKGQEKKQNDHINNSSSILIAVFLGFIMGLLGSGGGFLIIPMLIFMGFDIQKAISTSLFIISINSFTGFIADQYIFTSSDMINLTKYLSCAFLGMITGIYIAKKIGEKNLKKSFGYFIWIISLVIIGKEFIL